MNYRAHTITQDYILGTIASLIFINDAPLVLGNVAPSTDLYADDTIVLYIQPNMQALERNLQMTLILLIKRCRVNGMAMNMEKM